MGIADIVMECFAMESALLARAQDWRSQIGAQAADMVAVLLRDAMARIEVSARTRAGGLLRRRHPAHQYGGAAPLREIRAGGCHRAAPQDRGAACSMPSATSSNRQHPSAARPARPCIHPDSRRFRHTLVLKSRHHGSTGVSSNTRNASVCRRDTIRAGHHHQGPRPGPGSVRRRSAGRQHHPHQRRHRRYLRNQHLASGTYAFEAVQPGSYQLDVEADGLPQIRQRATTSSTSASPPPST